MMSKRVFGTPGVRLTIYSLSHLPESLVDHGKAPDVCVWMSIRKGKTTTTDKGNRQRTTETSQIMKTNWLRFKRPVRLSK